MIFTICMISVAVIALDHVMPRWWDIDITVRTFEVKINIPFPPHLLYNQHPGTIVDYLSNYVRMLAHLCTATANIYIKPQHSRQMPHFHNDQQHTFPIAPLSAQHTHTHAQSLMLQSECVERTNNTLTHMKSFSVLCTFCSFPTPPTPSPPNRSTSIVFVCMCVCAVSIIPLLPRSPVATVSPPLSRIDNRQSAIILGSVLLSLSLCIHPLETKPFRTLVSPDIPMTLRRPPNGGPHSHRRSHRHRTMRFLIMYI